MLTDAVALGLAAGAHLIAGRPADDRRHFGYHRAQVLAAFVNGILLLLLLGWIAIEALQRFRTPIEVNAEMMLGVALLGLAANAAAFFILHEDGANDVNTRGALLHVVSDLLGSVAAVIAALVIMGTAWTRIDPLLSLLVAALIGRSALRLIKETGHILLQGAPKNIDMTALANGVKSAAPGIEDVHDIRIWQMTPDQASLTMHARVADSRLTAEALDKIKHYLEDRYGIVNSTVQIEVGEACPDCGCATLGPAIADLDAARSGAQRRPHRHLHNHAASGKAALASHK
jgi:cobalt-zinc-cadmium efflux system protein